jgi:hypothetical protein
MTEVEMLKGRTVPLRGAVAASVACLAVGTGAAAVTGGPAAGAKSLPTGPTVRPGPPFEIAGYGYTCQSTERTPNFSCYWGKPYEPAGTPILTVFGGGRTLLVQSVKRPTISYAAGSYTTTFKK